MDYLLNVAQPVAPVVQLVTSKPSDVGTWDFSSQKKKKKKIVPGQQVKWRTINSWVHKIRYTSRSMREREG